MAEERALDIKRVTSAMDTTRQSIQDTLGELKERVQESADWRRQVGQRPLTSIGLAVACGLVLARILIPAAASARRRFSGSSQEERSGIAALPYLSGAIGLLGQLGAFSPVLAQLRRLVGYLGSRSRRG
jgi:hypothetical protein